MSRRGLTPLVPLALFGPAFRGLNTEIIDTVGQVDVTWALVLENIVWGKRGKPESRKGYINQTGTPIAGTPALWVTHEYVKSDGTTTLIEMGSDFVIRESLDDGVTWVSIVGALVTTTVQWQFVNFFDECYATGPGHKVWRYTGAGSFTEIATSPVTRGVLLSAYGRLWAVKDAAAESSIYYCALLDGTDWTGTATGTIDASNAWTAGQDVINGLAAFGAAFVVFGSKQILIYVDGAGSELGIDPDNMYVVDTIEGTGTDHKDSIVKIGEGDLWFMGPQGVQSLKRVVTDKNNPLMTISNNVLSLFRDRIASHVGSIGTIKAAFVPGSTMCLFLFPESNEIIMFDTKSAMEDGTYRCAEWKTQPFKSICARIDKSLVFGMAGGKLALYDGYRDDNATIITIKYASPWLDFGEQGHNRTKILKEASITLYGRETITGVLRWAVDLRPLEYSVNFTSEYVASGAEYAVGEYNEDEYGTGHRSRTERVALGAEGQYIQFQLTLESTDINTVVILQEVAIFAKPGKML